MVLGKLPVPGRPTIWMIVGQGPTVLAVGAGGGGLDILLSSIFTLFFFPLFGLLLVVWGLTALWDRISVYIGPSPREGEREEN